MSISTNQDLPLTLSVAQVAELLGICKKIAYDLVKREQLAIRVGQKKLAIPSARFYDFLRKRDNFFSEEG